MIDKVINDLFSLGVSTMQLIGEQTGMGYELANVVIFILMQPALILLFYWLWQGERRKKNMILNRLPAIVKRVHLSKKRK